ncbi:MAG TPA: DMT family transporter [Xanthobacteraceae bacterium]|nr:DMT family transporter [Xanthobacteraceae bacterium]
MQPTPSRFAGLALLAITAIGWGLNWPAIKFILADWPPLFSRGVAGTAGAAVLIAIALWRGESLRVPRSAFLPLAAAAFTNVFAWMGFTTIAMKYLSVAECALLVYTMPIWVTVLSWPLLGIRMTGRTTFALLLGCAGILTLFGGRHIDFTTAKVAGIVLSLLAAFFFALGSILNRRPLPLQPYALVGWQVGLACVPMIVIGLLFEHPVLPAITPAGWSALLYMALIPMALCYVTWFATLRRMPATNAAIGTLTVPVIGAVSAALLLNEPLGVREISAVVLTIAGVWLALSKPDEKSKAG